MSDLTRVDAHGLAALYRAGRADPVEVLEGCLERIAAIDGALGAFAHVATDSARAEARARAAELAAGVDRGPLHGIPVGIKELFDVAGCPGDYGSDVLAGRVPEIDAVLVSRLRRAGAVIVGTTRSHEFGWGITTQHATRDSTANPWDLERIPGGSSGGSGAAVASGMVPVAVGSDTGGSVRIPSTFCGTLGIKATLGRIPRTGGVALAPSFDTPGALTRSARDLWAMTAVMAGADPGDPIASGRPPLGAAPRFATSLDGTRVGVAPALNEPSPTPAVQHAFDMACEALAELGAVVVEVELPPASDFLDVFVPMQMAEAHNVHSVGLGTWPDREADYGRDVAGRIAAASEVDIGTYLSAAERRRGLVRAFDNVLTEVDIVISPVSAVAPSRRDDPENAEHPDGPQLLRTAVMSYTTPQNVTGLPTVAVPVGFDDDGLPVAVQLAAARWREDTAVGVAGALHLAVWPDGPRFPEDPSN